MRILVVALLLALMSPARAEVVIYDADGDADAGGSDPKLAALDEAFGRAVTAALADVLDADARKTNKQVVDREIVAHARLWVARYKIKKDETNDGRRQLTVAVSVDLDKMRARLGELNVNGGGGGGDAQAAHTTVVLLRVAAGDKMRATFGATAEKDIPGLGALSAVLHGGGYAVKRAAPGGAPARISGDLPVDDDAADALADATKADVATIAGVDVGPATAVRGVAAYASLVTAHVRVVARGKRVIGQGLGVSAARGTELPQVTSAIDRALVAAALDAIPANQQLEKSTGFQGDDTPIAEPGVVLVRVSAKTPYALVASEVKYLAGTRGITQASLRRVSPGGWVIGVVTNESVQRIANIAKKAPTADSSATSKLAGDLVEVTLVSTGAP